MKPGFSMLTALTGAVALGTAAIASDTPPEPLITKSAQRHQGIVFDVVAERYWGRRFQEIDHVDATELRVGLTLPVFDRGQLRLTLPFHTDGDARRIGVGTDTDVRGDGGTFEFATLAYEHQLQAAAEAGIDLMAYAGLGLRSAALDTSHGDVMNHRGRSVTAGIRLNRAFGPSWTLMGDIGYRFYWDTDDLNPSGGGDNFGHLLASGAIIGHGRALQPAVELVYRGNVGSYNNLAIVPEIVYAFDKLDLKAGIPIGLSNDADDYGVTLGVSYRM